MNFQTQRKKIVLLNEGPGKEIFLSVKQFLISFRFFFSPFWLRCSSWLLTILQGLCICTHPFLFYPCFFFWTVVASVNVSVSYPFFVSQTICKNMQKKNINGCFFHKWKSPPIDECLFKCWRDLHLMTQARSTSNNKDRNL